MASLIFRYMVRPACGALDDEVFCVTMTDVLKDNVMTRFRGKESVYTISEKDIELTKRIIRKLPEVFEIPEFLEPNKMLGGSEYSFVFSDGERSNSFSGFNILDYGRMPRKNATLALRLAREINQAVLSPNGIRTTIPSKLQHWPKFKKRKEVIKI